MAKKDNAKDAIQEDPRFREAELGTVDGENKDGRFVVEDLGDGLVAVKGPHGDVSVDTLEGHYTATDPELRQRAVDKAIELSRSNPEEDPRHSSHPDFRNPDGSRADGKDTVVNADLGVDKESSDEQ